MCDPGPGVHRGQLREHRCHKLRSRQRLHHRSHRQAGQRPASQGTVLTRLCIIRLWLAAVDPGALEGFFVDLKIDNESFERSQKSELIVVSVNERYCLEV